MKVKQNELSRRLSEAEDWPSKRVCLPYVMRPMSIHPVSESHCAIILAEWRSEIPFARDHFARIVSLVIALISLPLARFAHHRISHEFPMRCPSQCTTPHSCVTSISGIMSTGQYHHCVSWIRPYSCSSFLCCSSFMTFFTWVCIGLCTFDVSTSIFTCTTTIKRPLREEIPVSTL